MPFKLSKLQVFGKIALALLITFVVIYSFSALFIVNNRAVYNLVNTEWISRNDGSIVFTDAAVGTYKDSDKESVAFSYTENRGYVICVNEDEEVLFEFVTLKDDRIYSVNLNVMFYNIESLL